MHVNRSGYYKWRNRKGAPNQYEQDRMDLTTLLSRWHTRFPSYGYHRLASVVRLETGWIFSDNLAHKCCKHAHIRSKARHYRHKTPGTEHLLYPNKVNGNWNAQRPLELVVSDMTCLRHKGKLHEWVYVLDTFNNEIVSHSLARQQGDTQPYYACLEGLIQKLDEQICQVVLHTDQGNIYSSRAFAKAHDKYTILRSMSRAGTPTDNPIIEALNGWIKQEMYLDFQLHKCDDLLSALDDFVHYFNHFRPAYALHYRTPIQYKTERGF